MKIIADIHQGHEEWDRLRSVRPTASEFGKILTGTGRVSTQRETYMRRLAVSTRYPQPVFQGNKWTERGHELEPVARQRFIDATGCDVREVAFIQREDSIAGGSPDGLIYHDGEPVAGIEIKCYNQAKHDSICDKGILPTENKPQVHGHLWLSGLKSWIFVLYCPENYPRDFKMIEVTPDGFTQQLGNEVDRFCDDYAANLHRYLADYEAGLDAQSLDQLPTLKSLCHS